MSAQTMCPVDGCEWPIPTARLYPGPKVANGGSILRRGWLRDEDDMIEAELADHYSKHTTVEWLNTIVRLRREVDGDNVGVRKRRPDGDDVGGDI